MHLRIPVIALTAIALLLPAAPGPAFATPPPLTSDCTIQGTVRDDTLTGTSGADVICGLSGNDTIDGLGGDDLILGGVGADTIDAGDGADDVRGGPANDQILGGAGDDRLYGDGDDDTIDGGDDVDVLVGSGGADVLTGGPADDVLWGQGGTDQLDGGDGADKAVGGAGNDVVRGGAGVDKVLGEPGDDQLYGDADGDTLRGGRGSDTHAGGAGDDSVHDRDGAPFVDTVGCDEGSDRVFVDSFDAVAGDCEQIDVLDREDPVAVADTASVVEDATNRPVAVLANDTDADGGPIDVASVTQPAHGTVTIAGNQARVFYTPAADYCNAPGGAPDTFDYELAPGGSTATVSMKVACRDDAPAAADDVATVAERDPATAVDVLANDADADGDAFTIGSVTQPAHGAVVITSAGADLTYEPASGYCNSDPVGTPTDDFTYTLVPGGDVATVVVTVTCGNQPATAADDTQTVTEDDPATTIDVLANDDPGDHAPITVDTVTQPAHGLVVVTNGGADLTYEPHADFCTSPPAGGPTDDFTYTLDPDGDTATVAVTVTCVEDEPVADDDTTTVDEDDPATTVDVLGNDADAEGDAFAIHQLTQPGHGEVVVTSGGADLTYEPDPDYCNSAPGSGPTDDFTYTLAPGGDTAAVAVTVTCADDDPTAVDDAANLVEDDPATTIDVLGNDADPEGDPFTIDHVTQPAHGAVVVTNGGADLTYEPAPDYCNNPPGLAPDTFTYTLTPGSDSATVSVTVACSGNDAPVIGDVEAAALAYAENAPGTVVTATGTVADVDSADFDGGRLTVDLSTGATTPDRLEIGDQGTGPGQINVSGASVRWGSVTIGSFAGGSGSTPLQITLNSAATVAVVEALLRDITYRNVSDAPATAPRTVRFVVTDGDGGTSAPVTRGISVTAANDAPALGNLEGTALAYAENAAATVVTATGTVVDPDSANFAGGTLTIDYSAGGQPEDRLAVRNQGTGAGQVDVSGSNVTFQGATVGTFTGGTGTTPLVVTLAANTNPTVVQAVLRNITYRNVSDSPSTADRTVRFVLSDGDGGTSNAATRVVTVASVDDAPVMTVDSGTVTYTEHAAPVPISPNLTVADPDNATLTQAVVTFSHSVPGDHVTYMGAGTLFSSTFNSTTGVATINPIGSRTVGEWQTMLRTFAFSSEVDLFTSPSTTATFTVSDGTLTSAPQSRVINLAGVNQAPVIANIEGATLSYTENAAAVLLTATGTVSDVDSSDFGSGTLTVDLSAGGQAEDRLEIRNQGSGAGQIGVSGSTVTYGGAAFGSFSGGSGTTPLVITLAANTNPTVVQALLRNITYRDVAEKPSTTNRTVRAVLTDGDGGTSAAVTRTVTVVAVNDKPVVSGLETSVLSYAENAPAVVVTATGAVTDVDSTDFGSGTLTADLAAGGLAEDRLEIRNQGTGAGQVGVSGSTVTYGGAAVGSFTGGGGTTALVITFNGSSNQTVASAVLRNITYRNVSDDPATTDRTVRFVVTDGDGGTSTATSRVVSVTSTNDVPSIADPAAATTYTEGDPAALVSPGLVITDPDAAFIASATVNVTSPVAGDVLTFTNQAGITGSSSTPGSLVLSGGATRAQYETALRSVGYRSTSDTPGTSRSIVIQVNDGTAASNGLTRTVNVVEVDDAPVLVLDSSTLGVNEGVPEFVSANLTLTDADSAVLTGATISMAPYSAGMKLSLATPPGSATAAFDTPTGVLTITGAATVLQYRTALRSIKFQSTGDAIVPDTAVQFVVSDGVLSSTMKSRTIHVTNINDLPVLSDPSASSAYVSPSATPAAVSPGAVITDPDDVDMQAASVTINGFVAGDTLTWTNQPGITGTMVTPSLLVLSGTSSKANYQAALRSVGFRNTTSSSPGTSRTFNVRTQDAGGNSNTVLRTLTITSSSAASSHGAG